MKVWSNGSFLRAGRAEVSHSVSALGDHTTPSETSSKIKGCTFCDLAGWGLDGRELMNSLGWELIRGQFFNCGTWSEPLCPVPPHQPSMDTHYLSLFPYFFITWCHDSNCISFGRDSSLSYCFPLESPALLRRWLHWIDILHPRRPSSAPTRGWCGKRKTLACDVGLLWLKRHLYKGLEKSGIEFKRAAAQSARPTHVT